MVQSRMAPLALASFLAITACSRGDQGVSDTAAGSLADTPGAMATGMGSMAGPDVTMPPAKDADHEFLRMMSHHHEGLIEMASAAMTKGTSSTTQGDAHQLHTRQEEEQKRMVAMVQAQYGETVTPMMMPSNKMMMDSLTAKTGADYDRTFYRNVIQHHREGIRMIDEIMPRLTKADVRQMAEKMKADHQKEITEFERKAGA